MTHVMVLKSGKNVVVVPYDSEDYTDWKGHELDRLTGKKGRKLDTSKCSVRTIGTQTLRKGNTIYTDEKFQADILPKLGDKVEDSITMGVGRGGSCWWNSNATGKCNVGHLDRVCRPLWESDKDTW